MGKETGELHSEPKPLTSGQERAAAYIIDTLNTTQASTIVILEGLSGVGKTTLLERIEGDILNAEGRIVPVEEILFSSRGDWVKQYNGNLVTSATPGESEEILKLLPKKAPGTTPRTYKLTGMDKAEISRMASTLSQIEGGLTKSQIIKFSLGIPHLAQRLAMQGLTNSSAARISAKYLESQFPYEWNSSSLQHAARPYLAVEIPDQVLRKVSEMSSLLSTNVYDDLYNVLEQQAELKEKGIIEESPLFVAPESVKIYNNMLKKDNYPGIDVFVPDLHSDDLVRIQQALGYDESFHEYDAFKATRAKMFHADYRKVSFWHNDVRGQCYTDNEHSNLEDQIQKYMEAYKSGSLGLVPNGSEEFNSFYIHAHEHFGMNFHAVAIGWMTESLLQQRGIAYFVNNYADNSSYMYNPETQHIEMLTDEVNRDLLAI